MRGNTLPQILITVFEVKYQFPNLCLGKSQALHKISHQNDIVDNGVKRDVLNSSFIGYKLSNISIW